MAGLHRLVIVLLHLLRDVTLCADIDPFADSIPYAINWNGPLDSTDDHIDEETIVLPMVTKDKEKYKCFFRNDQVSPGRTSKPQTYSGPSGLEILEGFAESTSCSYRVESYWTYELCHGKHLRQYHEERDPQSDDGRSIVHPEYFLGRYKDDQDVESQGDETDTILLENVKYPYIALEYNDGTNCDLTGTPRRTTVQYICYEKGRGDLYQIKEASTCEYTAIVLVAELCNHPKYQPIRETSRVIACHSLEEAPRKPKMAFDIDYALERRSKSTTSTTKATSAGTTTTTKAQQEATRTEVGKSEDDTFLRNFLSGSQCLQGGTGWWSYELCYGDTAKQFHVEGGKRVTNILLGKWDLNAHLEWLEKHPHKVAKKKTGRRFVSQFYSEGDFCEETKALRSVEVKLKCMKTGGSPHAVAIYLLEPTTCQYILTVESPVLCELVEQADERGLIV